MILWEEYPRFRFARRDHGTVSYAVHGQLLLVFFFVKQDQNLVLRKSRLINGVAPDTVRNTFLRVFRRDRLFSLEYKPIRDLRERRIPFGVWNRNVDDLCLELRVCTRASCRDSSALAAILVMLLSSKSLDRMVALYLVSFPLHDHEVNRTA
ncbi:hypothetical protein TNCV_880861 [Trichonephila clavipes]|nr:hypothetical protein TNCV_880861 [Trichonephila clavipes]